MWCLRKTWIDPSSPRRGSGGCEGVLIKVQCKALQNYDPINDPCLSLMGRCLEFSDFPFEIPCQLNSEEDLLGILDTDFFPALKTS